jgi:formyltetrahydrofolate-dependent phosphoribosylglycinamide formyltransferase
MTSASAPLLRLAVLVSGTGRTLEGIGEAIDAGTLAARIVLVVSDRSQAPALERARRHGWPTTVVPPDPHAPEAWGEALGRTLEEAGTDLVVLAGFRRILPPGWTRRWAGRAINLHPSLLPAFGGPGYYGLRVQEAVISQGVRETGATVHWVSADVDRGPILAQSRIPVLPGETPEALAARLHPEEVRLLLDVLRSIADGTVRLPYARETVGDG